MAEKRQTCEEKLAEFAEEFQRLSQAANPSAEIVLIDKEKTILCHGASYSEVFTKAGLKLGDVVLINPMTGQIIKKLIVPQDTGVVASVIGSVEGENWKSIEVQSRGETLVVGSDLGPLGAGSMVVVNRSQTRALKALPPPKKKKVEHTKVLWSDIGGQEEAKEELREAIEYPRKFSTLWKHYGKRITKGVLLYGPPGCGKTLLGKAVATALDAQFVYTKGPEFLDPYVGVTEARLREALSQAKNGAVLFIDEADAILGIRGSRNSFMEKTTVPTFLTEVDGLEDFKGTVILATNRPDTMDPAVLRDGRIDRKVEVARPGREDTEAIFNLYLAKVPHDGNGSLAKRGAELVFDNTWKFASGHQFASIASGALVEGIVDKAISNALKRDMKTNKPSKVMKEDLEAGCVAAFQQNRAIS